MSGEERGCTLIHCRSWLASDGGLPAGLISRMYHSVGAAEGCDLKKTESKDRSLVALDSSYRGARTHQNQAGR